MILLTPEERGKGHNGPPCRFWAKTLPGVGPCAPRWENRMLWSFAPHANSCGRFWPTKALCARIITSWGVNNRSVAAADSGRPTKPCAADSSIAPQLWTQTPYLVGGDRSGRDTVTAGASD